MSTYLNELCAICRLRDTCQNNFDYECVEASDFLFSYLDGKWISSNMVSKIITFKDELDSNNALRTSEYSAITRFINKLIEHQYTEKD